MSSRHPQRNAGPDRPRKRRGRPTDVDRKMTIHECIRVLGILAARAEVMMEVDVVMLRTGVQHAAAGWTAACTGLPVAVARSRRRAPAGGPCRRWACNQVACGPGASQAGSGEAGERSWAPRASRRHWRRPRRCRQREARERLGKPSIGVSREARNAWDTGPVSLEQCPT